LVLPVTHTAANGLPLGAEANPKKRKMLLLDTGIFQRLLGLNIADILFENDFDVINKGSIAEQFVGLELLKSFSCYRQENLYFWHRKAKNSNAEVDYLIQKEENILPIEVKSEKKDLCKAFFFF
jgi:predicted AAA+ superfamily ATPase